MLMERCGICNKNEWKITNNTQTVEWWGFWCNILSLIPPPPPMAYMKAPSWLITLLKYACFSTFSLKLAFHKCCEMPALNLTEQVLIWSGGSIPTQWAMQLAILFEAMRRGNLHLLAACYRYHIWRVRMMMYGDMCKYWQLTAGGISQHGLMRKYTSCGFY